MRKNMKKLSIILSSILLSFSLFACSPQATGDYAESSEPAVQQDDTGSTNTSADQADSSTESGSIQLSNIPPMTLPHMWRSTIMYRSSRKRIIRQKRSRLTATLTVSDGAVWHMRISARRSCRQKTAAISVP